MQKSLCKQLLWWLMSGSCDFFVLIWAAYTWLFMVTGAIAVCPQGEFVCRDLKHKHLHKNITVEKKKVHWPLQVWLQRAESHWRAALWTTALSLCRDSKVFYGTEMKWKAALLWPSELSVNRTFDRFIYLLSERESGRRVNSLKSRTSWMLVRPGDRSASDSLLKLSDAGKCTLTSK